MKLDEQLYNLNDIYFANTSSYNIVTSKAMELIKFFKNKSITKLKQTDIEKLIKFLREKQQKNSTINSKLAYLSKALKYYKNTSVILPYQNLRDKTKKKIITEQQFCDLRHQIYKTDKELYKFILIAYYTGLRANEILNIRTQHITKQNNTYFLNIYDTKNHYDNLIPINKKINFVFKNFTEFTYNYKQVHYLLKKYDITAHQFRHTFITKAFERGLNNFTVMRLVNQKSITSTKEYIHLQNKFLAEETNKII